jgi:hypothetical protein
MAKSFKLQVKPTFKSVVEIPIVGSTPMKTTFTFKTFDRHGLAKVIDKWAEEGQAMIAEMREDAVNDNPWSLEKLTSREVELQAKQVKDIVLGWGFDDEFNDENIEALVSISVSVTDAIVQQYHSAYDQARKGN